MDTFSSLYKGKRCLLLQLVVKHCISKKDHDVVVVAMSRMMRALRLVLKLGRLKMTVFSAVTYATAASLIEPADFNATRFLAGWAFVFFTQLVAHFLGECTPMHVFFVYPFTSQLYSKS